MKPSDRQLAAIMFTDIVGYTALMGSDEARALSVLKTNRTIHKRFIKKYTGKWLKEMGDGTLASFRTIVDSVYCAGELIKECNKQHIELRIGIHFGDIVVEDGDIFGDGVNVASRLETLAEPNQIIVSNSIHRNIKNKQGISSTFIEEKVLKNVDDPVKIYKVEVDGNLQKSDDYQDNLNEEKQYKSGLLKKVVISTFFMLALLAMLFMYFNPLGNSDTASTEPIETSIRKSIAVLPFKDMSPTQDQEYLGDGIAEEIINRLTKVENLKVIGRTSSFSFKNKETDLKTIGKMLGVENILEGSVQKVGNQLRITTQLIKAEDGSHIWSERFDREFNDVFKLQDELAQLVVNKMFYNVQSNENKVFYSIKSLNPAAYEFYLKGDYFHREVFSVDKDQSLKNLRLAEEMFFKALDIQENYALAHAGLADLYNTFVSGGNYYEFDSIEIDQYRVLQREHIWKAYRYGPDLDYVNLAKGWVHLSYGEIDSAYQSFVKAIILNPMDESNYEGLSYFLYTRGLYNEASVLYDRAKEINPLDISILLASSYVNSAIGRWEEAIKDAETLLLIDSTLTGMYYRIFSSLILQNKIDEAEDILEHWKSVTTDDMDFTWYDGLIYACRKDTAKALAISDDVSWYYSKLGMRDEYINTFLQEYYNAKQNESLGFNYIWLINRTTYNWIKDDPRIKEIVQNEKVIYDSLKAHYGNLDFLDLH